MREDGQFRIKIDTSSPLFRLIHNKTPYFWPWFRDVGHAASIKKLVFASLYTVHFTVEYSPAHIYSGMKEEQEVLVTHGYGITKIGPELKIIATSDGHIQGKFHFDGRFE